MKAICKIKAYYNGAIVKPGEIVEIKGKKLPSWAKGIDEGTKNDDTLKDINNAESVLNENTTPERVNKEGVNEDTSKEDEDVPFSVEDDLTGKTEIELNAIFDNLLTQALDKGIEYEIDNKPVIEQIVALKQKLEGENK